MILFPAIDVLLMVAVILPFFSFLIKKYENFRWLRNGLVISGILIALYFILGLWKNPVVNLFRADYLGVFFSCLFLFFGFLIALYSFRKKLDSKFYSLFFFILAGLVGITIAKDFFTLWVFWELMSISSYALVWFGSDKKLAIGAALKYIFMSVAGSTALLFAISLLYGSTGTVNFSDLSNVAEAPLKIIITLIIAGFGVEAVIFPFHFWAPDVYQASNISTSALFASVLSKSGIFGLMRILYFILPFSFWGNALAVLALVTMTFGGFMALIQTNLKRLLAFASISHIGFIVFAISLGTVEGFVAGSFHALNHAILMASLFFCIGIFSIVNLHKLETIPRFYKFIFLVSALSAGGMPPFNGFISEVLILQASMSSGLFVFSAVLLFNMFLILAVFLRMIKKILPLKTVVTKVNFYSMMPMIILLLLILILGIYPGPILDVLQKVAS